MKPAFGLVRRPWGVFYLKNKTTGVQTSLKTSDKHEAQRMLHARISVGTGVRKDLLEPEMAGHPEDCHGWLTRIKVSGSCALPNNESSNSAEMVFVVAFAVAVKFDTVIQPPRRLVEA